MSDRTACKAREGGGPSDVHVVFPYADLQEQRHEDIYQHGVTARTATPQRNSRSSRSATTAIQGQEPRVVEAIRRIVADGRESGEFERKTPLDEVTIAIRKTAAVYGHPVLLELNDPDELKRNLAAVTGLILRSLAP